MKLIKQIDLTETNVVIKVHHDIDMNPESYIITVYINKDFIEDSIVKNIKFLDTKVKEVSSKWLNIIHLLK
jgi:hypothetical protein